MQCCYNRKFLILLFRVLLCPFIDLRKTTFYLCMCCWVLIVPCDTLSAEWSELCRMISRAMKSIPATAKGNPSTQFPKQFLLKFFKCHVSHIKLVHKRMLNFRLRSFTPNLRSFTNVTGHKSRVTISTIRLVIFFAWPSEQTVLLTNDSIFGAAFFSAGVVLSGEYLLGCILFRWSLRLVVPLQYVNSLLQWQQIALLSTFLKWSHTSERNDGTAIKTTHLNNEILNDQNICQLSTKILNNKSPR